MIEIYINARKTVALKTAILDAIENGQYDTLADDVRDCFTAEQIEQIEEKLETNDFDETVDNLLSDWSGDNSEELFEELKNVFSEAGIDVAFDDSRDIELDADAAPEEEPASDAFDDDTDGIAPGGLDEDEDEDYEDEDDDR